ncbi:MAG: 2-hydroxyacid dehydrogenase, partial [Tardiphaga sp.]|nr:2-hydroxyacid dehydrogenase [Tardiphaga sp.]
MEIAVFSTKPYDRRFIDAAASKQHKLHYLDAQLTADTAVLARGAGAACVFVNDKVDDAVLQTFKSL